MLHVQEMILQLTHNKYLNLLAILNLFCCHIKKWYWLIDTLRMNYVTNGANWLAVIEYYLMIFARAHDNFFCWLRKTKYSLKVEERKSLAFWEGIFKSIFPQFYTRKRIETLFFLLIYFSHLKLTYNAILARKRFVKNSILYNIFSEHPQSSFQRYTSFLPNHISWISISLWNLNHITRAFLSLIAKRIHCHILFKIRSYFRKKKFSTQIEIENDPREPINTITFLLQKMQLSCKSNFTIYART